MQNLPKDLARNYPKADFSRTVHKRRDAMKRSIS